MRSIESISVPSRSNSTARGRWRVIRCMLSRACVTGVAPARQNSGAAADAPVSAGRRAHPSFVAGPTNMLIGLVLAVVYYAHVPDTLRAPVRPEAAPVLAHADSLVLDKSE